MRFAVLRQLQHMNRPDALRRYERALQKDDDGLLLSQSILPNWPVARHSDLGWVVRMRSADGRLTYVRLPSPEELRNAEVIQTPMQQALLQSRQAIAQHRVLHTPINDPSMPVALPGGPEDQQALARALAFSLVQPVRH